MMLIYPTMKLTYPMAIEREYAKILRGYVNKVRDICIEHVPLMVDAVMYNAVHRDSWIDDTTSEVEDDIESEIEILALLLLIFNRTKVFNQHQAERAFESVFGSTPARISEAQYAKIREIWIEQNLELIRSIGRRTVEALHYVLAENAVAGVDRQRLIEEVRDTITRMTDTNIKRATLIACDQVGKLNSQLTQLEQMNQGVEGYLWVSMRDGRVRVKHKEYNDMSQYKGHVFRWDDPPPDGHPGWAIRCRCHATPVYNTTKIMLMLKAGAYKLVDNLKK